AAGVAVVTLVAHWNDFRIAIAKTQDFLDMLGIPIDAIIAKVKEAVTWIGEMLNKFKSVANYIPIVAMARAGATYAASRKLQQLQDGGGAAAQVAGTTPGPSGTTTPAPAGMGKHEAAVRAAIAAEQAANKVQEVLNKAWQPTVEQQAWFAQLQRPLDDYMNRLDAIEGFTAQVTRTQEIYTQQLREGKLTHGEYNQLMGEAETKLRTLKEATDELIKSTDDNAEENRQCYADGLKSLEQYQRASAELWLRATENATDYSTGLKRGLTDLWLEATNDSAMMQDAVKNAFHGMEDMVVDFVTKGKIDFKGFVDSILADLTRMLTRKLITAPLYEGLGLGGMATGGSPTVNQPVWVGERGPEIFKPAQAGSIVPNQQAAQASAPATINVINVDSMDKALAAMRSTEGQRIIVNSK
ncbi:MAG: hypothetical protein EHM35_03290, partial [Planctomycetaceae bacterium]